MNIDQATGGRVARGTDPSRRSDDIIDYYSDEGIDYESWSRNWNMHFGILRSPGDFFRRERMVEAMNAAVIDALRLPTAGGARLLDLGCGVGATARYAARHYSVARVEGVTIVPGQVEQARRLNAAAGLQDKVGCRVGDFRDTPFESGGFDGVYALESSCHTPSVNKARLLREMYRVLKPGGRGVVVDGFLKGDGALHPIFAYAYRRICRGWALGNFPHLDRLTEAMREIGFRDVVVTDLSWRVAPSIAHVPLVSLRYWLTKILLQAGRANRQQWNHLWAPLFLLIAALNLRRFGYFMVSGRK